MLWNSGSQLTYSFSNARNMTDAILVDRQKLKKPQKTQVRQIIELQAQVGVVTECIE